MIYKIYLRRNKVNGKCYVGQTSDFKGREYNWKCLKASYSNKYIDEDRAKYGLDNWTVEILGEVDNQEDALELEQRFINDYNSLYPNGYNLSERGSVHNHSEETKQKLSEIMKGKYLGEKNPFFGKHHTDETKKKLSETHKGNSSFFKGKHHTDEARKKMSLARKGKRNIKNFKKVNQYTLDGNLVKVWDCGIDAANELNISAGNISSCCNGKLKQYKGYKWSYNF